MLTAISSHDYKSKQGYVLNNQYNNKLHLLNKRSLRRQLRKYGFLLFRNFSTDIEIFTELVNKMSNQISLDPARQHVSKSAQLVDAGYDAIGLHCENGNSPFWPELCWFYCVLAPKKGSQTTVCDGRLVWHHLSPAAKKLFLHHDIVYTRNVEENKWKQYVYYVFNQSIPFEAIHFSHLASLVEQDKHIDIRLNPDNRIRYIFKTPAIKRNAYNNEIAFANSILGPSVHYERPKITLDNGQAIPDDILDEIKDITEAFTIEIDWQAGDVLLIDNFRFMHGRRKIVDNHRKILNALSDW